MTWVLPTYGRPERCAAALDAIREVGCSTPGIVIVDGDPDPRYPELQSHLPEGWELRIYEENVGMIGVLNRFFRQCPNEPWYGNLTDDQLVRTPGWDRKIIDAAGDFSIAGCDDGWLHGSRMCGAIVYGGELLRAAGWWHAPGLFHTYGDDVWELLSRHLGLWRYLPGILSEHQNPFARTAPADATHERSYSHLEADAAVFERLKEREIPEAIARIAKARAASDPMHRARVERVKSRSVMLCTPVARSPAWQYTVSFAETAVTLDRLGLRFTSQLVVGSSNLPRARNELCARFLASEMTDMVFIDDDMGWDANSVVRLLASEHEVIAGIGRKRVEVANADPSVWCWKPLSDGVQSTDAMGNIEAERIGTGFLKISRSALEKFIAAYPYTKRPGEWLPANVRPWYHQFFRFNEAELGEDFDFCDRWRAIGGTVWIDPTIRLTHVGEKAYTGAICEIMFDAEPMKAAAE